MPDDLYGSDILEWSERQVELLRRVANGERVNDVDWPNLIEEIADVGREQLNAVESCLRQAMIHLFKLYLLPDDPARMHWLGELGNFLDDAEQRFTPSMRQRIEMAAIFRTAGSRMKRLYPGAALPEACPWTLDDMLGGDHDQLLALLDTSAPKT
jgi:hypothetical protein